MTQARRICRPILVLLLSYVCCFSTEETSWSSGDYESWSGSFSFSAGSIVNQNPCAFRGQYNLHKQSIRLDPCTVCTCFNGTTTCNIQSCPSEAGCEAAEIVVIPEECCPQCPYKMFIDDISGLSIASTKFKTYYTKIVNFSLSVAVNKGRSSRIVRGDNLWKVSAWISPHKDGAGRRHHYRENVLNDNQASMEYRKANYRYSPWMWSSLKFKITYTGKMCVDYRYFCVRLCKADDPQPTYDLEFTFHPVEEEKLIACAEFKQCKGRTSVLQFNPNGTITIKLRSKSNEENTRYMVKYRELNTTTWDSEYYFLDGSEELSGDFKDGGLYELKISPENGDKMRSREISEIFSVPCREIKISLELRTSLYRHGRPSVTATWSFRSRTGECSVTSQTISVVSIALDNCGDLKIPVNVTETINTNERYYKKGNMKANTEYNVTVTVEDRYGRYSTSKQVRTSETVPTSPPDGIVASSNIRARLLRVRWNDPPCDYRNGRILSYVVEIERGRGTRVYHVSNVKRREATFVAFEIGETFIVRVAAKNSRGIGPYSLKYKGSFGVKLPK